MNDSIIAEVRGLKRLQYGCVVEIHFSIYISLRCCTQTFVVAGLRFILPIGDIEAAAEADCS